MKKALIFRHNTTAGDLYTYQYEDFSGWRTPYYTKSWKTLAGAKKALEKMGYDEIVLDDTCLEVAQR